MSTDSAPNQGPDLDAFELTLRRIGAEFWLQLRRHPIRSFSILATAGACVIALGAVLQYLSPPTLKVKPTSVMLEEALQALDAGELEVARIVAAELRLRTDVPERQAGVSPYVLGVVMHHDALDEWHPRERRAYFLMSARYLEESRQAGFPPAREGHAAYMLGKSLHGCERRTEALPPLQMALDTEPTRRTEILWLLTDGYLNGMTPDLPKAAEYNQEYLQDETLTREDRDAALLRHARITFELGRTEECRQRLAEFPENSPGYAEAMLLRGRLLFGEATELAKDPATKAQASEKYGQARALFAKSQELAGRNAEIVRQAQYLQGLCLRSLGDFLAAESVFSRNRRSHLETPEGLASGIEEAELQHLLGNDAPALQAYQRVLRQIALTPSHVRPWIGDEDLRRRLEETVAAYRSEPQFDAAAELLKALHLVFPDARSVELQAQLRQEWGDHLMKQASAPQAKEVANLRSRARQEYRQAGHDFGRLAKLRFSTRQYPQDLWSSAENYLRGQDYESAVNVYRLHLDNQSRTARPPALTRIGECLLALNRPQEALGYVEECIAAFPKDPFVYRARLIAATADLELGREKQAIDLLLANLENESLTPKSAEWRDSLFALGRIYYLEGHRHETRSREKGIDSTIVAEQQAGLKELELAHDAFEEAVKRLEEAVQRDPEAEQAIEARYMLAQAHFYSAKLPIKQLAGVNIETTKETLRREMQRELSAAITGFDELKTVLIARQEQGDLSPVENRILRNCYFRKADALFDLKQYEEAIQAYSSATNRYQQEPESLEAFVQIAISQRKLNRLADSRRTLEQARLVLGRMPSTADFQRTTRYDRDEWTDLLTWLSRL